MYERIYDYWKREKDQPNLQSIDKDFYDAIAKYIAELRERLKKTDEGLVNVKLARTELEKAERLTQELLRMRLRKILEIVEVDAKSETVSRAVNEIEKAILEKAIEVSKQYRSVTQRILEFERDTLPQEMETGKSSPVLIRFLIEMPSIIGADLKPYGPFKVEDVATLPLENAESLIRGKAAIRIAWE
jgi:DNA replication factor GINS